MVYKIFFYSEFPDIPEKLRRIRRWRKLANAKQTQKSKRKKQIRNESKRTETIMHSVVQKTAINELQIRDRNHEFTLKIESNKVENEVLLEIRNPN